ncbi:hypothetical protein PM082_019780 [Marasmius tenuissimus]|nr:hypothetical protein PM082_019780 [Marasmius tenuissimus]
MLSKISISDLRGHSAVAIAKKYTQQDSRVVDNNWGRSPTVKFGRWMARAQYETLTWLPYRSDSCRLYERIFSKMISKCGREPLLEACRLKLERCDRTSRLEKLQPELISEILSYITEAEDLFVLGMVDSFFHYFLYCTQNDRFIWRPAREGKQYSVPMGGMSELDWLVFLKSDECDMCYSDFEPRIVWDKQMHLGTCCAVGIRERTEEELGDSDDESEAESLSRGYSDEYIYGTGDLTFSQQHVNEIYTPEEYPELKQIGNLSTILPSWRVMVEIQGPGLPPRPPPQRLYDIRYFHSDLDDLLELFGAMAESERATFLQQRRDTLALMLAEEQLIATV